MVHPATRPIRYRRNNHPPTRRLNMTANHVDQLAQWYADAERITDTNLPRIGDTLIFPYNADGYAIEVEEDGWTPDDLVPGEPVRILARAPKPKPAWHGAVAVIAHTAGDKERRAMVKCGETRIGRRPLETSWDDSAHGAVLDADDLIDPVPLIEAKVTDEMVERGARVSTPAGVRYLHPSEVREVLTAALGLESA